MRLLRWPYNHTANCEPKYSALPFYILYFIYFFLFYSTLSITPPQRYIDDIRQGKGRSGKQYSARYVCSLVADFHRTLLYGGWCANPRAHLRLVYEANPLAMLAEQAGGAGSDGVRPILDIVPSKLHARSVISFRVTAHYISRLLVRAH